MSFNNIEHQCKQHQEQYGFQSILFSKTFDWPTIGIINLVSSDVKTLLNKSVIIYKSLFCCSITVAVHIVVSVVLVLYFEFFMNYPDLFKTI